MIGTTVSHYRITGLVGTGGMGKVYRAEDLTLPRPVALKFLSEDLGLDSRHRERFLREAQAASALDHPNICTIYEIGTTAEGRTFIAMPCYDGRTVQALLKDGPLPAHEATEYALGVAQGLAKAHAMGILHRDIKPANLFLTRDGVVKILDFGVAKLATETTLTRPGAVVGTYAYMSPEQVRGGDVDARTDIFSLGATLYEMVTGRSPFRGENQASTIHRLLHEEPEAPRRIRAAVPPDLDRVIMKALAKDRGARFSNMAEFVRELSLVQRGSDSLETVPLGRTSGAERGARPRRRILVPAATLAAVLVLLSWGGGLDMIGRGGPDPRKGIAVMAGAGEASTVLEAGVLSDLVAQVGRLAESDPGLWVVPPARGKAMRATSATDADERLGVGAVLAATVRDGDGGPEAELELRRAGSGQRLSGCRLPLEGEDWGNRLPAELVQLIESEPPGPGTAPVGSAQTGDERARRFYLLGLGWLQQETEGHGDSARVCFERALARDPGFIDAHTRRAEALYATRSEAADSAWAEEALASCDAALRLDPGNAQALLRRGRILAAGGRRDEALEAYRRAEQRAPRDPTILRRVAWTCFELGRPEEAEAAFRAAAEAAPGYWGGHEDLGYFYQAHGRYEEALAPFERLAELVPAYPAAYNYLGAVQFALERWNEAIGMFERSFELEKSYYACANLGTLYYMNGRFEDAVRMYEWAWEYDDSNYITLGNLGSANYWLPDKREHAVGLLRRAAALAERQREETPNDPVLLALLGEYYSVDRGDTAVACVERALGLAPDNAEVALRAAHVYEQLGERAKALVFVGRALELGYSAKEIEHDPQFRDLRGDSRYRLLADSAAPDGGDG